MGLIAVPILKSSAITGGLRVGWVINYIAAKKNIKKMVYRRDLCDKIKKVFGNSYGTNIPDITTAELRGSQKH
ncbi:hypothetical protein IANJMKHF_00242 [Klebsiella phage CPRSA]|nr:hypothetical protein IANJMKHF_00242 [Klebsiella phage CPRSA]